MIQLMIQIGVYNEYTEILSIADKLLIGSTPLACNGYAHTYVLNARQFYLSFKGYQILILDI
jgi:hypothetical protein